MRRLSGHFTCEKIALRVLSLARQRAPIPFYIEPHVAPDFPAIRRDGPLFLTARFRSGSTLLWQAFERLDGFTAYYEPLNERRWFDPVSRGEGTDETHRGVSEYHINYNGLEILSRYFTDEWTYRKLALGHSARESALFQYIKTLIEVAGSRPVLQFNRVDFRLPFLRKNFPGASIIHLERASRDVWRSNLKGAANDPAWDLLSFDNISHFYLLPWYRDLVVSYPWMLQDGRKTHPYFIHHLIWRLSGLFAREWADGTVSYEALCADFMGTFGRLLGHTHSAQNDEKGTAIVPKVCPYNLSVLDGLMAPRQSGYDHAADEAFYEDQEAAVEELLRAHLPQRRS
ncbi:MAG: hypothetical protein HWE25_00060 [Alphaproteobacteria bacterium]|nr:hypothetical protein [Alphaproteobacteria bacterium]